MPLTPWDIPAPNADDPAPRFVKPIPANDLHAIFNTHRPVVDDRPDLYESFRSEGTTPAARSGFAVSLLLWGTIAAGFIILASGAL
jgi:hypothetical protein